jgi:hypothetical protein
MPTFSHGTLNHHTAKALREALFFSQILMSPQTDGAKRMPNFSATDVQPTMDMNHLLAAIAALLRLNHQNGFGRWF